MITKGALDAILSRAESTLWTGPDPYDGLGSDLGALAEPFGGLARFAVAQGVLRSPALRWFASPVPTQNPKALGLFLGAVTRGKHHLGDPRTSRLTSSLLDLISACATPAAGGLAWGYPFAWQSRYFWAPAKTPNAVVTSTVAWHLLECADSTGNERALRMGLAAVQFLATGLNRSPYGDVEAISYTASDVTQVVNVSALAARAITRAARREGKGHFRGIAQCLLGFVLDTQREDGSWPYSTDARGSWEDSFHTGYVLESLLYLREMGLMVPEGTLASGFEAYRRFFGSSGEARLHPRANSVLDAHSAAQGILTYTALARSSHATEELRSAARSAAIGIADWALRELWIEGRGHFAYRMRGKKRDEREFTRWVSAWMALAMATISCATAANVPETALATAGAS